MGQLHLSDLRGLARLGVDGVTATTELVEHLHHSIIRVPGIRRMADAPRTRGITGLVYRSIHGVTGIVGNSLDAVLGTAASLQKPEPPSRGKARALAILNGVLGDHLEATGNPLAIPLALLRSDGTTVEEHAESHGSAGAGERLVVLLHGLCLDERCWQPDTEGMDSLPAVLERSGWSVLRLRYNTGRPIHANGADFADALERLLETGGRPVREIALVGHSMGGLVARSAVDRAIEAGQGWVDRLGPLVFLGTPHLGSPLERAGHIVDRALGLSRYSAPFARLGRMRSAGITDLRHGVLRGDGAGQPLRMPRGARCFAVAATRSERPDDRRSRLAGDGLVPVPSALGRHADEALRLPLDPARTMILTETGHLELLHHPEVLHRVTDWLA